MLQFFDVDPGSGMEKSRIRDKHPVSATLNCAYLAAVAFIHGAGWMQSDP
jgi:hypothetical protein